MSDCGNVEIRELLPEHLHGRLSVADRARVDAHLAGCEECAAELKTLQAVVRAYAHAPAIDTAAIVRALPRPRPVSTRPVATRQARRPLAWQIAAAVSFISLGGISLAVARSVFDGGATVPQVVATDSGTQAGRDTGRGAPVSGGTSNGRPAISFGGGVGDLATEDLEQLLGAIESLEAVPPVEPEVVPQETGGGRVRSDTSGGVQ